MSAKIKAHKRKKKLTAAQKLQRRKTRKNARWVDRVMVVIRRIRRTRPQFTTDNLWPKVPAVDEPRIIGRAMLQARADGLIVPTNWFRKSVRRECHYRPLRVWKKAC